jgi:hypothetical protein
VLIIFKGEGFKSNDEVYREYDRRMVGEKGEGGSRRREGRGGEEGVGNKKTIQPVGNSLRAMSPITPGRVKDGRQYIDKVKGLEKVSVRVKTTGWCRCQSPIFIRRECNIKVASQNKVWKGENPTAG